MRGLIDFFWQNLALDRLGLFFFTAAGALGFAAIVLAPSAIRAAFSFFSRQKRPGNAERRSSRG